MVYLYILLDTEITKVIYHGFSINFSTFKQIYIESPFFKMTESHGIDD